MALPSVLDPLSRNTGKGWTEPDLRTIPALACTKAANRLSLLTFSTENVSTAIRQGCPRRGRTHQRPFGLVAYWSPPDGSRWIQPRRAACAGLDDRALRRPREWIPEAGVAGVDRPRQGRVPAAASYGLRPDERLLRVSARGCRPGLVSRLSTWTRYGRWTTRSCWSWSCVAGSPASSRCPTVSASASPGSRSRRPARACAICGISHHCGPASGSQPGPRRSGGRRDGSAPQPARGRAARPRRWHELPSCLGPCHPDRHRVELHARRAPPPAARECCGQGRGAPRPSSPSATSIWCCDCRCSRYSSITPAFTC